MKFNQKQQYFEIQFLLFSSIKPILNTGNDIQPKEDEELNLEFDYLSSRCNSGANSRYICLSCIPGPYQETGFVELCGGCHKKYFFDKDNEFIQQLAQTCLTHKMDHLYLQLRTAIDGQKNH